MKRLPTSKHGIYALVDNRDYKLVAKWKWTAREKRGKHYIQRSYWSGKQKSTMYLHRLIMDAAKGTQVDHINRNPLDNRRRNLRLCTHAQNQWNVGARKNNLTGFKGVSWYKRQKKFLAQIKYNNKLVFIGLFDTVEDAANAYKKAAVKLHGEFACYDNAREV